MTHAVRILMSDELHIAGIVVQARPRGVRRVASAIADLAGAQVHATGRGGRLVVTLEARSAREITSRIDGIRQLGGVLSALLVYQHNEDADAMEEGASRAARAVFVVVCRGG